MCENYPVCGMIHINEIGTLSFSVMKAWKSSEETAMKMKIRNKTAFTDAETTLEKENREVSYRAALEGIVLLENDGTLPLSPGKIALYGAGADMTIKGGTGSGEVNERRVVSVKEGLEKAGFTVTTEKWIDGYAREYRKGEEEYKAEFQRRLRSFRKDDIINIMSSPYQYPFGQPVTMKDVEESGTDTCVYVVARQAGEGADRKLERKEYSLSDEEKQNIAMCAANYEKLIVVINTGSVFDMNFLDEIEGINAVVYLAQQGMEGGRAFADILCGKVSPSAKTVDTWPKKYEDIPCAMEYSYLNGNTEEEYYREGIYVGYRYFDTYDKEPKYPFGYGLSYTTFSVKAQSAEVSDSYVKVTAEVTNTGSRPGKEIVQLYVSCPQSGMAKEYQRLAAFAKTKELARGESETAVLRFPVSDLASFREEDASFVLEAGDYILRLGTSSRDTEAAAVLVLDQETVTEVCDHVCLRAVRVNEIPMPGSDEQENDASENGAPGFADTGEREDVDLERIHVKAEEIEKVVHSYEEPDSYSSPVTDRLLAPLSVGDLCELVVGSGMTGQKRFFEAPGAAGYTTGELLEKGIPNICLADGPAGLRLQKVSAVTRDGKVKGVEPQISVMNYLPDIIRNRMLGNPEKRPCVYQFATSFPTGTALAQSWNTALLEEVGEAVGKEMEAYGVTYWLAPGMNIHRNPLCGRNFEYYSEDPLLTGKMAAAISRGVQSRRGCFVTVKHFCCNNQEDNRNHTNANVNERALREIYLRGFRIALREGGAKSVMSCYNKVNGTYVNNSYDLLTKVLRNEWGFSGLVMTDWFATGKGLGSHSAAIEAGNDLIMPGGRGAVRELKKKVRSGELEVTALQRCAANVLRGIVESRIYQAYRKKNAAKKKDE